MKNPTKRGTGSHAPPKKRKPKMSDAEQSALFVKTARDLECDESGKAFMRAFKRVTGQKQR